ncbi:MAG: GntR family transcriptional regulator [bacterium]|nr:GntR family transcriptional regulator [bacterium]
MKWELDKNRPICPQICEQLCLKIVKGEFQSNERVSSVREVALSAGVNPNTVQRSFEELERQGILYSVRGSGWFVSDNVDLAKEIFENILNKKTKEYFAIMNTLGLNDEEIKEYVKEWRYE